jgi:uncharacterized membrane protein (TIGR02234 family)
VVASRRPALITVLVALAGALLTLVTVGREWAHGTTQGVFSSTTVTVSGRTLTAAPYALALVAAAGALALLATRRFGRALVALLLVLAGFGIVGSSLGRLGGLHAALAASAATMVGHTNPTVTGVSSTFWPYVAAVGGALVAAAGIVAVARGQRWPGMSSRYDAPAASDGATGGRPPRAADPEDANAVARSLWDAVERGEDPTAADRAR